MHTICFNFCSGQNSYYVHNFFRTTKNIFFLSLYNNRLFKSTKLLKITKNYQLNKEKLQERSREYYRYLSEDEKIKNINYANIRIKNMSDEIIN